MHKASLSLLLTASLVACSPEPPPSYGHGTLTIRSPGGGASLAVAIARTPEARAHGLMGRASLPPNHGMAFVFDEPTTDGFWMKDTPIRLSVAFWDSGHRIVEILDMQPCRADPCPMYWPDTSYVGAVEANQGYFARHGLKNGDHVDLIVGSA